MVFENDFIAGRASIVIPVYNGANYMEAAIDSALAQTWRDTEVIVVNDGSTDGGETDRIAKSYGDRIRYIAQPNGGVASALNTGIHAMTGEVFCWLSHDDRHLPEKLTRQFRKWTAMKRPKNILIADYRLIDESGAKITDVRLDHEAINAQPLHALLRGSIHGCSVFVPRTFFEDVGQFDLGRPTTQDYDLWNRGFRAYPFVHMDEVLIESRWHDEQGSKKIDHVVEATDFWIKLVDGLSEDEKVAFGGTRDAFYAEMATFLAANQLPDAAEDMRSHLPPRVPGPLVSIIIPVFNRVQLAISAVHSAMAQAYPDTEIIVVDDGSTEPMEALEAVLGSAENTTFLRQSNAGPASARNRGWRAAKGKYVAFLDSDDLYAEDKIARQVAVMEETGAGLSHTSYMR
ncbi:MAG: glycosyltransferase, partial [Pseudomonadota bacterium]